MRVTSRRGSGRYIMLSTPVEYAKEGKGKSRGVSREGVLSENQRERPLNRGGEKRTKGENRGGGRIEEIRKTLKKLYPPVKTSKVRKGAFSRRNNPKPEDI